MADVAPTQYSLARGFDYSEPQVQNVIMPPVPKPPLQKPPKE